MANRKSKLEEEVTKRAKLKRGISELAVGLVMKSWTGEERMPVCMYNWWKTVACLYWALSRQDR
jgi:hypothetical protein